MIPWSAAEIRERAPNERKGGAKLAKRVLTFLLLWLMMCPVGTGTAASLLKIGDRGVEVREMQTFLIVQGYLTGRADGVFGLQTVQALKKFQKEAGLTADGICGEATMAKLKAAGSGDNNNIPVGAVIKPGMRGEGVRYVQELLSGHGYLNESPDGVFGKNTEAALRKFQRDNGLNSDGVCGAATYAALWAFAGITEMPAAEDSGKESAKIETFEENTKEFREERPGHVVYVEATAYSPFDSSKRTCMGTLVRRGIIAVDPKFIPLGTKVFIPGYGEATAEDIGGNIKGNRIDIAFDTHAEALAFGRQDIELFVFD